MTEQTFVIIKPDAMTQKYIGRIISRLEDIGLTIDRIEMRRKGMAWCRKHYRHIWIAQENGNFEEPIYSYLEAFMVDQPIIGIILFGPNAISRVRRLIGATNPLEAEPGTIRGDLGTSFSPYNLIHASDSDLTVEQEIKLFFNKETDT